MHYAPGILENMVCIYGFTHRQRKSCVWSVCDCAKLWLLPAKVDPEVRLTFRDTAWENPQVHINIRFPCSALSSTMLSHSSCLEQVLLEALSDQMRKTSSAYLSETGCWPQWYSLSFLNLKKNKKTQSCSHAFIVISLFVQWTIIKWR